MPITRIIDCLTPMKDSVTGDNQNLATLQAEAPHFVCAEQAAA
jgi:hypothetical protein